MVTMGVSTTDDGQGRALLRQAGLRITRPRLAVLAALHDHQHADTTTILDAVRKQIPSVSHQAVYDCLHALTEARLVRSLQPAGSTTLYEIHHEDNHHHLVCRTCGRLVDVPCAAGETPCTHPVQDHGYAVDEAEIYYWGLCPACLKQAEATVSADHDTSPAVSNAQQ